MNRRCLEWTKRFCTGTLLMTMLLNMAAPVLAQEAVGEALPTKVYLPLVSGDPQSTATTDEAAIIPGQYIVVLAEDLVSASSVAATAATMAASVGGEVLYTYDAALNGFAVKVPVEHAAAAMATLQADGRVSYVEADRIVMLDPSETPTSIQEQAADEATEGTATAANATATDATQFNPPWGLDRVDQRTRPLNGQYSYNNTGAGVQVYIIDSGIQIGHNEFQGRASDGVDLVDGSLPANDCNGHGTHVAGTVGGRTYGVAKGVRLIAVRIFDCSGGTSYSRIIAAVNWVTTQKRATPTLPMVANMSLGGSVNNALNSAVQKSITAGVTYAVSAGNDYAYNACLKSPASAAAALTVAATDWDDWRAEFSNIGNCLDLFAPGVDVLSAWYTSNSATAYLSGTSMATPHVAGVAALYLQNNPNATPAQVTDALLSKATTNVVTDAGNGSPNRLLYSQVDSTTPANCFPEYGHLPAIVGTTGNDPALIGTDVAERMCGLTGNDLLYGEGGDDIMTGNEGADSLYGGRGNDTMNGGKDVDYADGGPGDDTITGGQGDDQVYGGEEADIVYGNDGNDTVGGSKGADYVFGDLGNDQLYGGEADDNLWGGAGRDTFHYSQGQGNDVIHDFEWSNDRLRLYSATIRSYTQRGSTCQLNLSTGATIQLTNVGTCRTPATAASAAATLPTIQAHTDGTTGGLTVQGLGFGAGAVVTLAINDTQTQSVQADEHGAFTVQVATAKATRIYVVTVPAYSLADEASGTEELVGVMVERN